MIKLHKPELSELKFRQEMLSDEETMRYNHAWGGTIEFPEENRKAWYDWWIRDTENKRFYRYLFDDEIDQFVGEIAYHYDSEREIYITNVIVMARYRGKGYGSTGLKYLCAAAKDNGISVLYDDIAIDNKAIAMFIKNGFIEEYRTDEIIMLKKEL